jgi:cytochrome c553
MPAWPAPGRSDEVWGTVAFLRELPSLNAPEYRRLVGEPEAPVTTTRSGFDADLARCARCHGTDGVGRSEGVPVIAGQSGAYLLASLRAYAEGKRSSGMMKIAVSRMNDSTFEKLARHYADQRRPAKPARADAASTARGKEIAEQGLPRAGVPACLGCHGGSRKNPLYPKLSGQKQVYMESQLRLFADNMRGGTAYAHVMTKVAKKLSDRDISDIAAYFASMKQSGRD